MTAQLDVSACGHLQRGGVGCTQTVTQDLHKPFPSEEPYLFFFPHTGLRGTPIKDEHAGGDTILCASELSSAFDFWKPGQDSIQDANYFAAFSLSAPCPLRDTKSTGQIHDVCSSLIPGQPKRFMLKALS